MTPSGTPDWRKVKSGKTSKNDDDEDIEIDIEKLNSVFNNASFPDVANIEVLPTQLGGSTGAVLIKDKITGEKYVMKKGASKAHVEEEFLTNAIYQTLGVEVPQMKIYASKTSTFMLSKFIENSTPANNVMDDLLKEDITAHFVADCLLANWDAYKNDNILVDTDTGRPVRVDNGGGLRFSATGRDKGANFGTNVSELTSMIQNNKSMTDKLTQTEINDQIMEIVAKSDEILALIEDEDLREIMEERLDFLENRIVAPNAAPSKKKIKDQYKKLSDKQLEKAYNNVGGEIAKYDYKNGWLFLNEIAKLRGFDGLPEVLDEADFNKEMKKDGNLLVHRGITGHGTTTAKMFMDQFTEGDCFFGTTGMYGAGIYGAVNTEKGNYTQSNPNYATAYGYANGDKDHIMDCIIPKSAKVIDADKLDEMMAEEFFGDDFKEKKAELDTEVQNMYDQKKKIEDFEKKIELDVKANMGWNEKAYKILMFSKPEQVYADTDKHSFKKALTYFSAVVKSINGKMTKLDEGNYEVSLPNSQHTFILNDHSADIALKQKNSFSTPYNFHYQRFKEFIIKNHYRNIQSKVEEAIFDAKENNTQIADYKDSLRESEAKVKAISTEVDSLKTTGSATLNKVMAKVASRPNGEFRGFYAAIKGYDVIIQKGAHYSSDKEFAIILNRSKVIVKKFKH